MLAAVPLLAAAVACGPSVHRDVESAGFTYLTLNGRRVAVMGGETLLDVLRARLSIFRLGQATARPNEQPIFCLNNVRILDGLESIARIRAGDIDSVRTILPTEAVVRYGGDGRWGAVLVFSRTRDD